MRKSPIRAQSSRTKRQFGGQKLGFTKNKQGADRTEESPPNNNAPTQRQNLFVPDLNTEATNSNTTANAGGLGGSWLRFPTSDDVREGLRNPIIELAVTALVLSGCLLFALQTLTWDQATAARLALAEDAISVAFAAEYLVRWYGRAFRPSYLLRPAMIIDFIALLPLLLRAAAMVDVQGLTFLRILRVLRLQRFFRDVASFQQFANTLLGSDFYVRPYQLRLVRTASSIFTLLFITSGLIYIVERDVNPNIPNFFSAFYFSITTLTTVGFGDIVPVTPAGKAVVSVAILLGICLIPYQLSQVAESLLASVSGRAADPPRPPAPGPAAGAAAAAAAATAAAVAASGCWDGPAPCEVCGQCRHEFAANFCWNCGAPLARAPPPPPPPPPLAAAEPAPAQEGDGGLEVSQPTVFF